MFRDTPLWYLMVREMSVQHIRELHALAAFDVNETYTEDGKNYLSYHEWQLKDGVDKLRVLLDLGLRHATFLHDHFDSWGVFYEKDTEWVELLLDYGFSLPDTSPFAPWAYVNKRLASYAARVRERRHVVQSAVTVLLTVYRRILGRDMARLLGRLVWATRRDLRIWKG